MRTARASFEHSRMRFALSLAAVVVGAVLAAQRIKRTGARRSLTPGLAPNEEVVRLPDGRRVAVASHGDPQGEPLLLFHGIPGSRLGHEFADAPARERGVRVLCPDRPGIGLSDPKSDRTLSGYSDDVAALADALGLERFAVVGVSGGGPYALACGAKLPDRVTAVGVMAGVGPLDRPGAREGLSKSDHMLLDLSLRQPLLARLMLLAMGWVARVAPSMMLKSLADELGEYDRRYLEEQEREPGAVGLVSTFVEALRQGAKGTVEEYRVCGQPWGFALEEVRAPVHLWQGEDDRMVPVHHAEDMAFRLPRARLDVLPRTGHISLLRHFGDMLDALPTD
jgi:pimeloyl-ACP methyl ester carboxylesterase